MKIKVSTFFITAPLGWKWVSYTIMESSVMESVGTREDIQ